MPAILTATMRVYAAKQFMSGFADSSTTFYTCIGRTLPWADDTSPPNPVDCENDRTSAMREMFAAKRISATDVCLVIPRNNWTIGTVYTRYSSSVNPYDASLSLPPAYVVTDSLAVYKCISNNNGAASTIAPSGTSTSIVTLSDGYQWKYMYTVGTADIGKFVTSDWVPVRTLTTNDGSLQWTVQQSAVPGTIDRIDLVTSGNLYTTVPNVSIAGDGTGATATATISGGRVTAINMLTNGSGYTYATVSITGGGAGATGATATAIISPYGGHGSDPEIELGAFYSMVNTKLIHDESGAFPTTNDYRRLTILKNPRLTDGVTLATGLDYSTASILTFSAVSGTTFAADETVFGSVSGATGSVLDWNSVTSTLRVVQATTPFLPGETVAGATASGVLGGYTGTAMTGTTTSIRLPNTASTLDGAYTGQSIRITGGTGVGQSRLITSYVGSITTATVSVPFSPAPDGSSAFVIAKVTGPAFSPTSGDILYIENRRPISRSANQTEDIKIIIEH